MKKEIQKLTAVEKARKYAKECNKAAQECNINSDYLSGIISILIKKYEKALLETALTRKNEEMFIQLNDISETIIMLGCITDINISVTEERLIFINGTEEMIQYNTDEERDKDYKMIKKYMRKVGRL